MPDATTPLTHAQILRDMAAHSATLVPAALERAAMHDRRAEEMSPFPAVVSIARQGARNARADAQIYLAREQALLAGARALEGGV